MGQKARCENANFHLGSKNYFKMNNVTIYLLHLFVSKLTLKILGTLKVRKYNAFFSGLPDEVFKKFPRCSITKCLQNIPKNDQFLKFDTQQHQKFWELCLDFGMKIFSWGQLNESSDQLFDYKLNNESSNMYW